MTINSRITEILSEVGINKNDGLSYLLSLYYELKPTYIPEELKIRMNMTGIYRQDETTKEDLQWLIPLFSEQQTAFDWVKTEYIELFKVIGKGTHARESITRMKKLFASNPDIRKDEILGATRMYINSTDQKYVRLPHYFIEKGTGSDKTQDILDWVDKYRMSIEQAEGRNTVFNTMQ